MKPYASIPNKAPVYRLIVLFASVLFCTLAVPQAGADSSTCEDRTALFDCLLTKTIRPNGEILEGNPAQVDNNIPLTRDNYKRYHPILLKNGPSNTLDRRVMHVCGKPVENLDHMIRTLQPRKRRSGHAR